MIICRCGCNETIKPKYFHKYYTPRFIRGHHNKIRTLESIQKGLKTKIKNGTNEHSEETKRKIGLSNTGSSCLLMASVAGCRRVPEPPARMMPFLVSGEW